MVTAIIGVGEIGSALARILVEGGERVILADRDRSKAARLARQLGDGIKTADVGDAILEADVVVLAVQFDEMTSMIPRYRSRLVGRIVVDPSNPVAPDGKGRMVKTIPDAQSSGQIIAGLLPEGSRFVKAFGTLSAESLLDSSRRFPDRVVLFYATDDDEAGETVAELIDAAGFDAVNVGGVDQSIRIEVGGDLHEFGGPEWQIAHSLRGRSLRRDLRRVC